eukprot:942123-Prymnesium_polylepis.1
MDLIVSFRPHQLGMLRGTIKLLGFGGKVSTHFIRLQGQCSRPSKREPIGGVDKLPTDFKQPSRFVERAASMPKVEQDGQTLSRQQTWEVSAAYEETNLSLLQALRKRKTFKAQQSKREIFDTIDRMDTGFELTSEEQRANGAHRQFYTDFLKIACAEREA